jgi:hypothetical protein
MAAIRGLRLDKVVYVVYVYAGFSRSKSGHDDAAQEQCF